jgi:O-antigen ligase
VVRSSTIIERLYKTLIFTGSIALAYGLVQVLDMDPVDWNPSGYTRIFGFLGNPNFQSAFLGMFGSALFASILFGIHDLKLKGLAIFGVLASIFTILDSESEQGFMVLGSGVLLSLILWTVRAKRKPLIILSSCASSSVFLLTFLGILNKGPLSSYLYKDSIQFRGDYWRTAWNMGMENPILGLGLDRYGENYRLYRDALAATRRGPDVTSNSPHNVFLDYLTNSGFLAFSLYILLHLITLTSVILYLRRTRNFSPSIVGLFAAWIAYVAQSVISVNQLGLAVWGWVLMGALIGLKVSPTEEKMREQILSKKSNAKNQQNPASPGTLLRVYAAFAIGGLISLFPLYRDIDMVSSLKSGDAQVIENQAYSRPLQAFRMFETASILLSNNLNEQSLRISRTAVKSFPNTFELWKLISVTPGVTDAEIATAQRRMRELDPNNPTLK